MEIPIRQETMHIELQDLTAFKSAVAASMSSTAAQLLGYGIDGYTDVPSFQIKVEDEVRTAYVSGVALSESYIDSVIIHFDGSSDGNDNLHHYAAAWPGETFGEWTVGLSIATDDTATDNFDIHPRFPNQTMSEQLKQLDV